MTQRRWLMTGNILPTNIELEGQQTGNIENFVTLNKMYAKFTACFIPKHNHKH